jgi:hypothetical protein
MIIEEKNVREYRRSNQNGQPRETGNIGTQDEEKTKQNSTKYFIYGRSVVFPVYSGFLHQ